MIDAIQLGYNLLIGFLMMQLGLCVSKLNCVSQEIEA